MLPKVADPAEPVSGLLWNLLRSLRRLFYDASGGLVLEERGEEREEVHLRTCSVMFEGEPYEVEKFFVGEAASGPELGVDAGGGETGDGVDLVEEHSARATL